MSNLLDNLWVEKYRPKTLKDVVLPDSYNAFFQECIDNKSIPNLLFFGGPGCGKSTIARILIDHIIGTDKESRSFDLLSINGSSQNGIEVVRSIITDFIKMPVVSESKTKIIHIDEFDYMTQNAQAGLRNIMEEYSDRCRFIFTLNYKHKVIDPILSRTQSFEFANNISKEYILSLIKNILTNEGITEYNDDALNLYINKSYPDIRKIIQTIQSKVVNKELISNVVKINNTEEEILKNIASIAASIKDQNLVKINGHLKDIEKLLNENDIEYMNLYNRLFSNDNLSFSSKIIIGKYCNKHQDVLVPQMHFLCMIMELVEVSFKRSAMLK